MNSDAPMMNNPFVDNATYTVETFGSKDEWRRNRIHGIGGSDASASLGMSHWMTNVELWKIKTGRIQQDDISDRPSVRYGTLAESPLRELYKLENENKYQLFYKPDVVLVSRKDQMFRYSPDGLLIEKETGRLGIWECKTTSVRSMHGELWRNEIPKEYYIQVLHGMNVTGAEFIELHAQIQFRTDYIRRTFHIERNDVLDDLELVWNGVKEFCTYIENDEEPPLWIN